MKTWILVMMLSAGGAQGGVAMQIVEGFLTEAECQAASANLTAVRQTRNFSATCIARTE